MTNYPSNYSVQMRAKRPEISASDWVDWSNWSFAAGFERAEDARAFIEVQQNADQFTTVKYEYRIVTKDGRIFDVEAASVKKPEQPKPIEANLLQMAGKGLEIVVRLEARINELHEEIGDREEQWAVYDEEGKFESAYYTRKAIDEAHGLLRELERIMNG